MSTIAERVAAGAAFLDEHEPGWADRIGVGVLDIGNCHRCVLGQVFGSYASGAVIVWDAGFEEDEDLGFFWEDSEDGDDIDALTAEWKRVITERRVAA